MAKKKLTEMEWVGLMRRLVDGEKCRALSREFGIPESTIRNRRAAQFAQAETVAKQIVVAEESLRALPHSAQLFAVDLAAKLRVISGNLASAAANGAETAKTLSRIAAEQSKKVKEGAPMESQEELQAISALTKISNDAASIGMQLLAANRAAAGKDGSDGSVQKKMVQLSDEELELIASGHQG